MKYARTALLVLAAAALSVHAEAAETTVFVPLGVAGEVLVIDAAQDKVVGTIRDVPDTHGLAATPDGKYLVAGTYAETAVEETPPKPAGLGADEHASHHAKSADQSARSGAVGFVSVIDVAKGAVTRRIEVPGAVHHVTVTPDGRFALATLSNGDGISVIDLSRSREVKTISTGSMPNYVVASADGKTVYVTNGGDDTLSEIDARTWAVRRTFATGVSPEHMVLSSDGLAIYVSNVDDGTVSEILLAEGKAVRTFSVGGTLHGIDLSEDGRTLFVSAMENQKLVAIDLNTGVLRETSLAPAPYHLATIPGTGKVYVSSAEDPKIWVIDGKSLTLVGEIAVPGKAHQMAVVRR